MRVAIYGGSFNPPHVGHGMVAAWLTWTDRVDEVWLVPTFHHAFDKPLAPFERRVAACTALAALIGPRVRVETVEATLPAPSYTVQTLDTLAERHPGTALRLVVGADVVPQLPLWRSWEQIESRYRPIIVGRVGFGPGLEGPMFSEVSSTEIRRRLADGASVDDLVPPAVLRAWCG